MYWLIPTQILTYYMKSDLKIRLCTCFTLGVRARWGGLWNWELFFHPTLTCQHKSWSSTSQDFFFFLISLHWSSIDNRFTSTEFLSALISFYALANEYTYKSRSIIFFTVLTFFFSGISFCSFIRCRDWGALSHIWHPGNIASKDGPPTPPITITSPWAQWDIVS